MTMDCGKLFVTTAVILLIGFVKLANSTVQPASVNPLTLEKMGLILRAKQLSVNVYYGNNNDGDFNTNCEDDSAVCTLESGDDFGTDAGVDRVYLVDEGGYCTVAFKGSEPPNPDPNSPGWNDWVEQNFDTANTYTVQDGNGNSCGVQGGFFDAYVGRSNRNQGTGYQRNVESWIENCMESRGERQLVFTGHSQGGSAATIAGIIHAQYDPITINFGAPPVIVRNGNTPPCNWPVGEHFWRIINTEMDSGYGGMDYDPAPFLGSLLDTWHVGSSIILQPDTTPTAAKYIDASNPERYQSFAYFDADFTAHDPGFYEDRIKALYTYATQQNGPIDLSGFPNGSGCRYTSECSSNRCDWDSNNPVTSVSRCFAKVRRGGWCNEDSDCRSNNCRWWYKCG